MRVIKTFKRTIGRESDGTATFRRAVVYYHAGWEVYFVRFYLDAVPLHMATRPAESKEDAIATADFWVNRGE